MALVKCRECSNNVSNKAPTCPHCGIKYPSSKSSGCLVIIFVGLIVLWALAFIGQGQKNISQRETEKRQEIIGNSNPETLQKKPGIIGPGAINPLDKKNYPNLYKKWGKEGFQKINNLLEPAANHLVQNSSCDTLDLLDVSDTRSIPKQKIVFFADCANGQRYYVSEDEIANHTFLQSTSEKTANFTDEQAIEECIKAVKHELNYPLSFSEHWGTRNIYRAEITGNIEVTFKFEAKNALGAALPHKARCIITDQGINQPEISTY